MKNERGITLVSLIVYIIMLLIVTAMLSTVSMFFFSNTEYLEDEAKNVAEFNKFNMYFVEDVKKNSAIYSITDREIVFNDGTTYTYQTAPDYGIYRNKVKICSNIAFARFTISDNTVDGFTKKIVNVKMLVNGTKLFETDCNYVLKYW